jgi:hypothetical protein
LLTDLKTDLKMAKMISFSPAKLGRGLSVVFVAFALSACGSMNIEADYPQSGEGATEESGSVLDFFSFGNDKKEAAKEASAPNDTAAKPQGLAVNADLWRGALDTISFLPLASADPMGGTIITDWYNDPGQKGERLKVNIVISGLELRADAVRVSLFREKRVNGRWTTIAVNERTARQLENIVLTKARDFKIARGTR